MLELFFLGLVHETKSLNGEARLYSVDRETTCSDNGTYSLIFSLFKSGKGASTPRLHWHEHDEGHNYVLDLR